MHSALPTEWDLFHRIDIAIHKVIEGSPCAGEFLKLIRLSLHCLAWGMVVSCTGRQRILSAKGVPAFLMVAVPGRSSPWYKRLSTC